MLSITQKSLIFLTICLPIRLQFMKQALQYPYSQLTIYLSYFYLLAGVGILYLYIFNKRLKSYESGGNTWWHQIRPIFSVLWLGFFLTIFFGFNKYAYLFLLIEVIFGLISFLVNLYRNIYM